VNHVGARHRPIDWAARSAGRVSYSGDVKLEGLLEGAILRSPHPHAKIRSIDTTKALRMPGVHAVVTSADLPRGARYFHEGEKDRAPLADGIVRFVGEEVAAVAAETRAQAYAVLRLIDVDYELLTPALDVRAALKPGTNALHARATGEANVSRRVLRQWGDAAKGRNIGTVSVSGTYHFPRQAHVCMEAMVSVAQWDEAEKRLHFWTTTQAPYYVVREVTQVLGLAAGQVVCHEVGVGGGFGAKSKICDVEVIAGLLARAARRPVRVKLSREEEFETTKTRHAFETAMRLHADTSGRLRAIDASVTVENGAYNHSGASVMSAGLKGLGMMYRPEGVELSGQLIDTSMQPGGSFRGYGTTQTSFALECLMDELAEKLGLDPFELRIRNANQPGETTLVGARLGSARLVECLNAARKAIDWDAEKAQRRPGRGVGVAAGVHVSGSFTEPGANRSDAAIDIFPDSRVRVRFGGADAGTGQKTIMAQIAAQELGVAYEAVDVLTIDSERTPFDMGSWSSRGTHFAGHAVRKCALETASRLKALAALKLGEGALRLEDGTVKSDSGSIALGELARLSNESMDGVLSVETSYVDPVMELPDKETGRSNISASYNFATHAAVVEVDRRTGQIRIIDYVAAHDIGTSINPTLIEGQTIGGVVMGLGVALGEAMIHEQGKMVNGAYLSYAMPRSADMPRIRPIMIEGGDPNGPYGAKAIGECSINPPAAVIANAVYDAIGVRIHDLPITPDKILRALAEKEGRTRRHRIWARPSRWWIALVRQSYPLGLLKLLHGRSAPPATCTDPAPLKEVATPDSLPAALVALNGTAVLMGGGTDVQLRRRQRLIEPETLVALRGVAGLKEIGTTADGWVEIGTATSLAALATAMRSRVPMIAEAIDTIASPQIRQMATLGGNLIQEKRCWFYRGGFNCFKRRGGLAPCYAIAGDHRFHHNAIDGHRCQAVTPSDLATVLLALEAQAVIVSPAGERTVPMADFYTGPGETVVKPDEILRTIRIPPSALSRKGAFTKLRLWEGDFAIVSAAITVQLDAAGRWQAPRIVLGALASTPWRAFDTERRLAGQAVTAASLRRALDAELDAKGHPLARNAWKLDAAAGIAEAATEVILARREAVGG